MLILIQLSGLRKGVSGIRNLHLEIVSEEDSYRTDNSLPTQFVMAPLLAFCGSTLSSLFFFSLG
jgi:hypothetical protein